MKQKCINPNCFKYTHNKETGMCWKCGEKHRIEQEKELKVKKKEGVLTYESIMEKAKKHWPENYKIYKSSKKYCG